MQESCLLRSLLVPFQPVVEKYAIRARADSLRDFGPIPFPAGKQVSIISAVGEGCGASCHDGGTVLALSSFALSQLSGSVLEAHLEEIHRSAQTVIFIDFKVAERNIELPAAMLFGALRRFCTHASNAFHRAGGMEGLLHDARHRFRIVERETRMGGGLYCIWAECL